jgi:hypothetical protein
MANHQFEIDGLLVTFYWSENKLQKVEITTDHGHAQMALSTFREILASRSIRYEADRRVGLRE